MHLPLSFELCRAQKHASNVDIVRKLNKRSQAQLNRFLTSSKTQKRIQKGTFYMKWARPVSRAGSHYRSGSACALFPHNSILCVYIRRRAGALAEISARATTILGKRASPPTKRKQGMSGASPVKPASLANRAGSLHINRPSVWRKHLHACRKKNTNIHRGKCFFVAIFRASLSTFIYSALRF